MNIQLSNTHLQTIVDEEDYKLYNMQRWNLSVAGYVVVGSIVKGKPTLLHRIIMNAKKGEFIDHINRNKLDNRKSNLRFCSLVENQFNRCKQDSPCKYKGVSYSSRELKHIAYVSYKNKTIRLHCGTKIQCAFAYDCATKFFKMLAYENKVEELLNEDSKKFLKQKVEDKLKKYFPQASWG